jgi:hypothetical protein
MINVQQFKNKIERFQENVDYAYDESKKTYTIYHEELKNTFWGDASKEVEYKAMEDERGNIQLRKSATFRSSKVEKKEQTPFVYSVEKMRDKQWRENNLGNFPKTTPSLLSTSQKEKDNSQGKARFPAETEEEFGYYREWKPFKEPTNTVYHRERKGNNYFEKKVV